MHEDDTLGTDVLRRARLVGIVGPVRRPEGALVEFDDGRRARTSPRLSAIEARQIADLIGGSLRPLTAGPHSLVHWLLEPFPVIEVLVDTERGDVGYVRICARR